MKAILTMALIFTVSISFAQGPKKAKSKPVKSQITTPAPQAVGPGKPLHALYLDDDAFNELFGAANNGFDKWILTTPIPANQIPQERQYFAGLLQNLAVQQKAWQKADADSIAKAKQAAKIDTTKKK